MTEDKPTPEALAAQLQELTEKQVMPDWLKNNVLTLATNIELIAPREEVTDLPVFIYFH